MTPVEPTPPERLDMTKDYGNVVIYEVVGGEAQTFDQLKAAQGEDGRAFLLKVQEADLVIAVNGLTPYVVKDRHSNTPYRITRKELLAAQGHAGAEVIRT